MIHWNWLPGYPKDRGYNAPTKREGLISAILPFSSGGGRGRGTPTTAICVPILLLFLAACQGDSNQPSATEPPPAASITIDSPQDGTVVYAETLYITGQTGSTAQNLKIELVDIDDNVIAETTVNAQPGGWQIELPHGYTGDPSEVIVRAVNADAGSEQVYDSATILISDITHRPDGIFGSITYPANGIEVGGDMLLIEGRASGAPENTIIVELVGETVIDSQVITLMNPYFVDEVPWQAELATNGYTGQATIQVYITSPQDGSQVILDSIIVTVITAAG